jgi:hypothetical protein
LGYTNKNARLNRGGRPFKISSRIDRKSARRAESAVMMATMNPGEGHLAPEAHIISKACACSKPVDRKVKMKYDNFYDN